MWKKKIEGDPPLLPSIHFYCCGVLLNKLLMDLFSWKFVNVSTFIFIATSMVL